eukprot:SAG11_NODE_1154_length_5662_cov_3.473665_2_plen_89_part_00
MPVVITAISGLARDAAFRFLRFAFTFTSLHFELALPIFTLFLCWQLHYCVRIVRTVRCMGLFGPVVFVTNCVPLYLRGPWLGNGFKAP